MVYGYARVSTEEQNLERQLQQLKEYVEERYIVCDKCSGKDFQRPGYIALVGSDNNIPLLRSGDTLVVTSIDRLGRNYTEIKTEWQRITKELQVKIKVLDMPVLSTEGEDNGLDRQFMGDLVLEILAYVAEKERRSIKERQRQGIDAMPIINGKRISTKTGCPTGRPEIPFPKQWVDVYNKWQQGEITATEAIRILDLKRTTFYRLVGKYKRETGTA
jgi:DNA invertase Pin-like site-specific DNA recombinase